MLLIAFRSSDVAAPLKRRHMAETIRKAESFRSSDVAAPLKHNG